MKVTKGRIVKLGGVPNPDENIKAWSFSRFHVYRTCPRRAKFKFLDKLLEPSGPALDRGNQMHKSAEEYVLGKIKAAKLHKDIKHVKDELDVLAKDRKHVTVEAQWAFDAKWQPVEWFAKDAWVRVVADATHHLVDEDLLRVIDYKTGKVYPYHEDQLSLEALAGFLKFPTVGRISAELWYFDQGQKIQQEYVRADVPKLKKLWEKDTKAMLADRVFKAHPGNECKWCHFKASNGGPCTF